MKIEEYWEQTREMWVKRATNPHGSVAVCRLCRFSVEAGCGACPVVKVYGGGCKFVDPVRAYFDLYRVGDTADVEELSALAWAVVQELDDKKIELIAAMREMREEEQDGGA